MTVARQNWKRLGGQMAAGAITGAGATAGVLFLLEGRGLDLSDPGQMLAIIVGMIYGLVGLVVALGVLSPNVGSRLLNVEDADELREEGPRLGPSAFSCVLIGLFFLALAAAPGDGTVGMIGNGVAAVVAGASLIAVLAISLWTNGRTDELTRLISIEASATTMHVTLILGGVWAALAHLGFVGWISPLALIAGLALLQMLVIFWACAKRGMLTPRG